MLRERDLRGVLDLAGEAHDAHDLDEFRTNVPHALKRLVRAEIVSYNEVRADGSPVATVVDPEVSEAAHEAWAKHALENPLIARLARTRDGRAYRWSDVTDVVKFRQTPIFNELYRPYAIHHQIAFALPSPPTLIIGMALMRARQDFTARDRAVLDLARPHLIQAYRNAELRGRLRSLVSTVRGGLSAGDIAVVIVERGVVAFASEPARELAAAAGAGDLVEGQELAATFNLRSKLVSLPLADGDNLLVRRERGDHGQTVLVLARASRALPLDALEGLGLTPAEARVLQALARGRSTAEAAAELGISPRTLHKHMQHVNAKLGVHERAQAVATAWAAAST